MIIDADPTTALSWFFDHIHIAFWVAALGFIWRLSSVFNKHVVNQETVITQTAETKRMVMEVQGTVGTIKDNHLEHLASDVKEVGTAHARSIELLQSIDKNIAVMAATMPSNKRSK